MAVKSIAVLKTYFETGDKPTQEEFGHLIDSFIHKQTGLAVIGKNYDETTGDVSITFSDNSVLAFNIKGNDSEPISFIDGLQAALDSKVDKEAGKGLSSNDFTNELKTKLENLENYNPPTSEEISFINGLQAALDEKALDSQVIKSVNNTAPDVNGNVDIPIPEIPVYTLAPSTAPNSMDLLANGTVISTFDLSTYLDDTNLARIVSGVYDPATKLATFTRDDSSTFTLDLSALELGVSFADEDGNVKYSGSLDKRTGMYDEVNEVYYPDIKETRRVTDNQTLSIFSFRPKSDVYNQNSGQVGGPIDARHPTITLPSFVGSNLTSGILEINVSFIEANSTIASSSPVDFENTEVSTDIKIQIAFLAGVTDNFFNSEHISVFSSSNNYKDFLFSFGKTNDVDEKPTISFLPNPGDDVTRPYIINVKNVTFNPIIGATALAKKQMAIKLYNEIELRDRVKYTGGGGNYFVDIKTKVGSFLPKGEVSVLDENGLEQFKTNEIQFGAGFSFNAAEKEVNFSGGLPVGYYEEYTFTPQMFLGTGSTGLANEYTNGGASGRAIRTGNIVYFEISFRDIVDPPVTNISGNNGVVITGLPVASTLNSGGGNAYAAAATLTNFRPTSIEAGVDENNIKGLITGTNILLITIDAQRVTDIVFNGGSIAHELSIVGTYITNVYTL